MMSDTAKTEQARHAPDVEQSRELLTVVIPVYNRRDVVGRTLESVAAQTLRPLHVILVDNNSTDGTLRVLQQWKEEHESRDFRIDLLQEKKPGAAAARNCGLRQVDTPYTMFFDSDDLMTPDHCSRAIAGFKAHPDAEIVGWNLKGNNKILLFSATDTHWYNIHYGSMATQRYVATTDLFRRVGGWRDDCLGWDDTELGTRLLLETGKIVKLQGEPTVEVIFLEESMTGTSFSSGASRWEQALDMIEENYRRHYGENSKQLGRMLRMVNLRRAILAGDYRYENAREQAAQLLDSVLAKEPSLPYRCLYRLACGWRSLGLPGAARLLRPFF